MSGFKKHPDGGVSAEGTVHRVQRAQDGKTGSVTLQHTTPKEKPVSKGGVFGQETMSAYPQESSHEGIPAEHLEQFPVGSKATVHLMPSAAIGDSEGEGDETGGGDEKESAGKTKNTKTKAASMGAKGPKQAGSLISQAASKRGGA